MMQKFPLEPQSKRSVEFPVIFLLFASALVMAFSLYWGARQSDRMAYSRQSATIKQAIRQHEMSLARELKIQTVWADAYNHTRANDQVWMHDYYGAFMENTLGYARVYVLDDKNEPIYSYMNGSNNPAEIFESTRPAINDLIEGIRGRIPWANSQKTLTTTPITLSDTEIVEHRTLSDIRSIAGSQYAVIVSYIVPDSAQEQPVSNTPYLLIALKLLDSGTINTLGTDFGFNGLKWATGIPEEHVSSLWLSDVHERPVGILNWRWSRPGIAFLKSIAIPMALALGLLLTIALFLVRTGRRQADLLTRRSCELFLLNQSLERRVAERTRELDLTLTNIQHGIVMIAANGSVPVMNARVDELLSLSADEKIAELLPELTKDIENLPPDDRRKGNLLRMDIKRPNGKALQVSKTSLADGGSVFAISDITALKAKQAELKAAIKEARTANQAKSQFLSTMSHEMRTPLNGVIGALDLLQATELTPLQREYANMAQNSGDALLAQINDVLDFSKLEARKLEMDNTEFNLPDVLSGAINILRPQATAKANELIYTKASDGPDLLVGDAKRLRQVLLNLLGNANKFTSGGKITLQALHVAGTEERPEIEISVTDTGIGISKESLPKLFQEFSMVDSSYARSEGGTGLGLAISKRLIEAMGGTIGVSSEHGKGSRFWFKVPFERATPKAEIADKSAEAVASAGTSTKPLNILVVDDNATNRAIAKHMLTGLGHTVTCGNDGLQAIKLAQQTLYDLILMDISMPGLNGIEATAKIRKLPAPFHRVTIFALTANALDSDRARFIASGMDDCLTKPFRRTDIEGALAKLQSKQKNAA